VLAFHDQSCGLLSDDLRDDGPCGWFVLIRKLWTGPEVPSDRCVPAEDFDDSHVVDAIHIRDSGT
jgi:hypothetical protein